MRPALLNNGHALRLPLESTVPQIQDYMLAYSLRKHAGVRSYVLPMDLSDSETWGNVDVDWSMQHQVRSCGEKHACWEDDLFLECSADLPSDMGLIGKTSAAGFGVVGGRWEGDELGCVGPRTHFI